MRERRGPVPYRRRRRARKAREWRALRRWSFRWCRRTARQWRSRAPDRAPGDRRGALVAGLLPRACGPDRRRGGRARSSSPIRSPGRSPQSAFPRPRQERRAPTAATPSAQRDASGPETRPGRARDPPRAGGRPSRYCRSGPCTAAKPGCRRTRCARGSRRAGRAAPCASTGAEARQGGTAGWRGGAQSAAARRSRNPRRACRTRERG